MISTASRQASQALVTRPREEAEGLAAALAARGVQALIEPLIEVRFRAAAPPDFNGVQALLCTSANGVRALARVSGERRISLLAVGDATAARARAEGFASVASAGGNAADLARLAAEILRPQNGRLLHVSGSAIAGDLVGDLRARGFAIERLVLYDARPISGLSEVTVHALRSGKIDFALFFSLRTAASFVELAKTAGIAEDCERITALSISAATDTALAGLAWRERRIAASPDQQALLCQLDALLARRQRL
jgi:uroporphyrinogen-III synthase